MHKLQGTYQPSRYAHRAHEPQAESNLADEKPPAWMTRAQKAAWVRSLADAPKGILGRIDRQLFTIYVVLVDRFEAAAKAQNKLPVMDAGGKLSSYFAPRASNGGSDGSRAFGVGVHPGVARLVGDGGTAGGCGARGRVRDALS